MLLLPPKELEKVHYGDKENIDSWLKSFVCIYLYRRRKECVGPGLNRPTLMMEKQRGAVNINIREDESNGDATVLWVVGKWGSNSR